MFSFWLASLSVLLCVVVVVCVDEFERLPGAHL
jgi:hypothetical protein